MADKHHYETRPPSNMTREREGTPRNAGSPPPDAPLESYSRPPRTQSAKPQNASRGEHTAPGTYAPQPGVRPGERVKRPNLGMKESDAMGTGQISRDKPTGTVEPERRAEKAERGFGGVPGQTGAPVGMPGNWRIAPDPQEGFKPPGRARKP